MADILIRGMEMPRYTAKAEFGIDADGNPLCMVYHGNGTEPDIYDVVPLPEGHGRLIDGDCLLRDHPELADCDFIHPKYDLTLRELIEDAPTIVPAEGGGEDGR